MASRTFFFSSPGTFAVLCPRSCALLGKHDVLFLLSLGFFLSRIVHHSASVNTMEHCRYQPSIYRQTEEALQVVKRKLIDGRSIAMVVQRLPSSQNGGAAVATVIVRCYWSLKGCTREVQGRYKSIAQIDNSSSTHLLPVLHGNDWATTVPPFCNHDNACASFLPPLSHI